MNTNTNNPPSYEEQHKKWISYLTRNRSDKTLKTDEQHRLSLAKFFYEQQTYNGYDLYHLTLTYKPLPDYEQTSQSINRLYLNFHIRYLLPLMLGTKNIHFACNKLVQPIVMTFLDEHSNYKFKKSGDKTRLHHHAILAVNPNHKEIMDNYIGENSFRIITNEKSPYMTSDLKPCDAMRVLYASKMYWKYPDFLSFPDNTKRNHRKHRLTKHTKHSDKKLKIIYRKFEKTTNKFLP